MRSAEYWKKIDHQLIECNLCPNYCKISDGKRGKCLGRGNKNGEMILYNYALVVAAHLDPIEKKPLYHFCPGTQILSIGTYGCNLSCKFCQNCEISQQIVDGTYIDPEKLLEIAIRTPGSVGVAFTYNEPGIWFEYVIDCAKKLKDVEQKVVLVTNGYLEEDPWRDLCKVTDAMNIDLKSFSNQFYKTICGGSLEPVLKNIEIAVSNNVHVEITNLVVTGKNDSIEEFQLLVEWISGISKDIPLHISRYFPRYKETAPPTSINTLLDFANMARKKLNFVYVGNIEATEENKTKCQNCGAVAIERFGYITKILSKTLPSCSNCGYKLPIIVYC